MILLLVQSFAHQLAVMYLGNIVEVIPGDEVAKYACHPYTQALLDALFSIHMEPGKKIGSIEGEVPSPLDVPPDVRFRIDAMILPRSAKSRKPKLTMVSKGHLTACRKGRKKTFIHS